MDISLFRNRRQVSGKATRRVSSNRRMFLEQLEDRRLLAADWHNSLLPADVNADRRVSPIDVLQVINMLETGGSTRLPELAAGANPTAFYDTTGDGFVSPLDALLVINAIDADRNVNILTDITSLSSHYIQATFRAPVAGALLSPDAYVLTGPDSTRLSVMSVAEGEAPNQVILTTAAPAVGALTVALDPSVTSAISIVATIEGNKNDEFYLMSSVALSNTSVLLTFSDILDKDTAEIESFYRIVAANDATPAQDVGHVVINEAKVAGRTVILETSSLQNIEYQVKVTNVLDGYAKKPGDRPKESMLIDPTKNTSRFFGIAQSNGLALSSAVSMSETTVLLSFSEPAAANTINPTRFSITDGTGSALLVTSSEVSQQGTRVTLTTLAQAAGATYTVNVSGVTDLVGNLISSGGASKSFVIPAAEVLETTPPQLVGAVSTSDTSTFLSFNEPLAESSVNPTKFNITDATGVALLVTGSEVSQQGTRVTLTTLPQAAGASYTLTVTGVTDLVGNLINATQNSATIDTADAETPDTTEPEVTGAIATSPTSVLVSFSEPLTANAADPTFFTVTVKNGSAQLFITDGQLSLYGTQVLLTTLPQLPGVEYTVTVKNVADLAGNLLAVAMNNADFVAIDGPTHTNADTEGLPRVVGAASTGNTSLIVSFSEPVDGDAIVASNYVIVQENVNGEAGALLVTAAEFVGDSNSTVKLTTMSQNELTYTVTVVNVRDLDGNSFAPPVAAAGGVLFYPSSATFPGTPPGLNTADVETQIVTTVDRDANGIIGIGDLIIDVNGAHYVIRDRNGDEELTLDGKDNLVDENNNGVIDAGDTVITDAAFGIDSDGDGLTDNEEQRGWVVSVTLLDGSVTTRQVTSDPLRFDTDDDGFSDSQELALHLDPRDKDTDDDLLPDAFEFNTVFSDPARQDTDGDGLDDGAEHDFFHTSPLLADTDGDQFTDDLEIILDNRNPLLADLPTVLINVGNVDLRLDVRFEEQTSNGTTTVDSKSVATTLAQSQESSQSKENSSTLGWEVSAGAEVCAGGSCEKSSSLGPFGFTVGTKFHADAGGNGSYTNTFTSASTKATQREYATSLTTDKEFSAESVVSRVVEGATIGVAVNLVNASNVAFTIRNIEITALTQDPRDPTSLTAIATLFAASDSPITIGPLSPTRGPFRFTATEAFPELVESLMQNPRGMIFQVANYEIEDELGRNFSFVEQDINDRTAFFEIDYKGELPLEKYRVATTSDFDEDGKPVGLTMSGVMENLLGLRLVSESEDEDLMNKFDSSDPEERFVAANELDSSYSTRLQTFQVRTNPAIPVDLNQPSTYKDVEREVLYRVKSVSPELTDRDSKWWVLTPQGLTTPAAGALGIDFGDVKVLAGQDFAFKFVKDLDNDALEADVEALFRSIDSDVDELVNGQVDSAGDRIEAADGKFDSADTDNDGIDDGDEVYGLFVGNKRDGWTIRPQDGQDAYKTFSNPGRADTDLDGLTDCQELGLCEITVWRDPDGVPTVDQAKVKEFKDLGQPLEVIAKFFRSEFEPDEPGESVRIIDDGDAGFETPSDRIPMIESSSGGFDGDYHVSEANANQAGVVYNFGELPSGFYRVSATWPNVAGAAANASFDVNVDGVDNFFAVDQSVLPNDFTDQGVEWENLGIFRVVEGKRFDVYVQSTGDGKVIADAIRVERVKLSASFATDPSKADTDGDGLTDAEEIAGFRYITLEGKTSGADVPAANTLVANPNQGYATNPLSRDTDNDGFPDWQEVKLGTNPTVSDRESVRDDDGDGLVNLQETIGWAVEWKAGDHFITHATPSRRDPDSDDDGLSDWEEFTGCRDRDNDLVCDDPELQTNPSRRWGPTNPNSADTDGDGLTDREEVDGFEFKGDNETTVLFTDPLNWDTDGDLRSDGDEALISWLVKIAGHPIRSVYSDPVSADGDGDGLSDSREFALGSDPNNPDSDGDGAQDGVEADRAATCTNLGDVCLSTTSVLVPDRWVTVDFVNLAVARNAKDATSDGDDDTPTESYMNYGAGDFTYKFGIQYFSASTTGSIEKETLTTSDNAGVVNCKDAYQTNCWAKFAYNAGDNTSANINVIQMREGASTGLFFNATPINERVAPDYDYSTVMPPSRRVFALPEGELFALWGEVIEWDTESGNNLKRGSTFNFGGIGAESGMFSYDTLETKATGLSFESSGDGPNIQVQVVVRAV